MKLHEIFVAISTERLRQEHLKSIGKFKDTCAGNGLQPFEKFAALAEEFGEVAKALMSNERIAEESEHTLYEELIHVAAVSVAWCESIPEDER